MCDCVLSTLRPYFATTISKIARCSELSYLCNLDITSARNVWSQLSWSTRNKTNTFKSINGVKFSRNRGVLGSEYYDFYGDLGFKEKGEDHIEFGKRENDAELENEVDSSSRTKESGESSGELGSSGMDFHELNGGLEDEDLVGTDRIGSKPEELKEVNGRVALRSGRMVIRRSSMLAKQVIGMQTANSYGFISQLWVDTGSWRVLVVEVRPNLLSGEIDRFFLEDVSQIGDVVLIQDEHVMECEYRMVGMETLVGYNVVTPGGRSIGKVRGYTFDLYSGAVALLEIDSFGVSIIPSSLVSTYAVFVDDVLKVVSDTVVVHEAASSHIQRLTKGFLGSQNVGASMDESDYGRSRKSFGSQKYGEKSGEIKDEWGHPMDYL